MTSTRSNETAQYGRRKAAPVTPRAKIAAPPSDYIPSDGGGDGQASCETQNHSAVAADIDDSGRRRLALSDTRPIRPSPVATIGQPARRGRKPNAIREQSPIPAAPSASPIGNDDGQNPDEPLVHIAAASRKSRTGKNPRSNARTSSASPIPEGGGGDVHLESETQAGPDVAAICRQLAALQRKRRFCITSQSRADRSMEALIASTLGYRIDATEADRKKVFGEARKIRLAVEKAGDGQLHGEIPLGPAITGLIPLIMTSAAGRKGWDEQRSNTEREMIKLARQLPVYPFAAAVNGLGEKGLAIIVGESGIPLSEWRTTSGLWKHMGLAVIDGYRQKPKTGARTSEEERQKYFDCPVRRGQIIGAIADPLLKSQWAAARDEDGVNPDKSGKPVAVPAHPTGPYGEIYAKRRAETEPRISATDDLPMKHPDKWTKGRCFNDARRVMVKELLADLRTAWRLAERDAADAAGDGQAANATQVSAAVADNPAYAGAGGHTPPETHGNSAPGEAIERIAAVMAAGGAS